MRRLLVIILLALCPIISYAEYNYSGDALLNRISMRFNTEQWLASKTALVTVGVNAGVSDAALASIQEDVIKKLNELSIGEWHIISFDRSLDAAGLEKIIMSAQARLPATALPKLRDKAKAISKPGETYTLDNVQFTPSEDEIRAAEINLRNNIYLQTKEELDRINKLYPEQKFYVHEINFLQSMMPQTIPMAMNMMKVEGDRAAAPRGNIAVGDKLTLSATVVYGATPDQALTKLLH